VVIRVKVSPESKVPEEGETEPPSVGEIVVKPNILFVKEYIRHW
jgi:hypothetical protein